MNARAMKETVMTDDPKISKLQTDVSTLQTGVSKLQTDVSSLQINVTKLQSDVQHIQSDVTEIKRDVKSLWAAIDVLKTEFMSFKAEAARDFGSVKASIERAKLWMVISGVGMILSIWGAALAMVRFLKP